ncbi:MAG: aminotransferase class V-fold PLP-dependent enzyme [Candidatus Sumerlaeia bacterium]|nr:aminotransferase class V-fold PLP-dependent enzyme [Candidatus Sumerlaeia bacterium]
MSDAFSPYRERAAELDAADELARFRDEFVIDDPSLVYLDGNSLGRLPKRTADRLAEVARGEWGARLIGGWNAGWWELSRRAGAVVAELIGARADEVVLCDSVSVNLFKLLGAFAQAAPPERRTILVETTNFPSDHYIAQGVAGLLGGGWRVERVSLDGAAPDEAEARLAEAFAARPAVAVLSHVAFKSGLRLDLAQVNAAARAQGVRVVWDFSHSAGAVPIDCAGDGVEAAVGCTYKYLNGGPGAPAFLYLRGDVAGELRNPVAGWFGHRAPFAMEMDYAPAPGASAFLAGTTPILSAVAAEEGARLVLEAGVERLWAKARRQLDLLRELAEGQLAAHGFRVATPRGRHGSHLSLAHPSAWQICQALVAGGVVPDFRAPDLVRFGIAPIYSRFEDIVEAAARLDRIMAGGTWRAFPMAPSATVT